MSPIVSAVLLGLLMIAGVAYLIYKFRERRNWDGEKPELTEFMDSIEWRAGKWVSSVAMVSFAFSIGYLPSLLIAWDSDSWESTQGVVGGCQVFGQEEACYLDGYYIYQVDGETRLGHVFDLEQKRATHRLSEDRRRAFLVGSRVQVYYDSKNERGSHLGYNVEQYLLRGIMGLIFLPIGLICLWELWRRKIWGHLGVALLFICVGGGLSTWDSLQRLELQPDFVITPQEDPSELLSQFKGVKERSLTSIGRLKEGMTLAESIEQAGAPMALELGEGEFRLTYRNHDVAIFKPESEQSYRLVELSRAQQ